MGDPIPLFELFFDYGDAKFFQVGHSHLDGDGPFTGLIKFKFIRYPIANRTLNFARR